jgi:hypothetical protein
LSIHFVVNHKKFIYQHLIPANFRVFPAFCIGRKAFLFDILVKILRNVLLSYDPIFQPDSVPLQTLFIEKAASA